MSWLRVFPFKKMHFYLRFYSCFTMVVMVDATKKDRVYISEIREGRKENVDRYDEVYSIVRNTFLLALAPVVLQFCYYILTDPDLPRVRKILWQKFYQNLIQRRILSNLSQIYEPSNTHDDDNDDSDEVNFYSDDSSSSDDDDTNGTNETNSTTTNSWRGQNSSHSKYSYMQQGRRARYRKVEKPEEDWNNICVPVISPLPIKHAP